MKRLRHPVRAMREPFGKAGLIVAMVALVAALTGGAYAASSSGGSGHDSFATASKKKNKNHKKNKKNNAALTGKQKREVEKLAKKYAGKDGANGAPGAQGPAGPAGLPGAKGATGAKGDKGNPGGPGSSGETVTVGAASSSECEGRGGAKFSNATGTATACNGPSGFTETLPSEATETGTWSGSGIAEEGALVMLPVSLQLPLAEPDEYTVVLLTKSEHSATGCPGVVSGVPTAEAGYLCVYTTGIEVGSSTALPYQGAYDPTGTVLVPSDKGTGATGTVLLFGRGAHESTIKWGRAGVWAVTGI